MKSAQLVRKIQCHKVEPWPSFTYMFRGPLCGITNKTRVWPAEHTPMTRTSFWWRHQRTLGDLLLHDLQDTSWLMHEVLCAYDRSILLIDGDSVTTVEREWYIFHRTLGHIVIFLDLSSEDLSKRIQNPFKEPENWKNRLLWRANWKETRINLYDELVIKKGLYSKTCKDPLTLAKTVFNNVKHNHTSYLH